MTLFLEPSNHPLNSISSEAYHNPTLYPASSLGQMDHSLKHAKCHVFTINNIILTSPYPFPPPNFTQYQLSPDDPDPSTTHIVLLSDNHFPVLAWVPVSP